MSEAASTVLDMHHPWRGFRDLVDWTLQWRPLPPGRLGVTNFAAMTVTLDPHQNDSQAKRRCTIAHESEHARRGPVPRHLQAREEETIDRNVARQLIDVRALGEALAWASDEHEAADELWVDVDILRARLRGLHPAERHYLTRRLAAE